MIPPRPGAHSLDAITEEARVILRCVPNLTQLRGVEVGTLRGKTASILLHRREGLTLHCVDSWDVGLAVKDSAEQVKHAWEENMQPYSGRVKLIEATSVEAAKRFPDGDLDFVYLDAAHDRASVAADIAAWWPKVRSDGLLMGHDYGRLSRRNEEDDWGVHEAVHEFVFREKLWFEHVEATSWAVRKP